MKNVEAIIIDCLTPPNIKNEQDKQPEIQMIKQWKRDGRNPDWSQIALYGPEVKAYWSSWESLILMDKILYKQKPINTLPPTPNWSPYIFYASSKSKNRSLNIHAFINKPRLYQDSASYFIQK